MNENQKQETANTEEMRMSALLYRNRWFILITTFLGAVASIIIAVVVPVWFAATTSVVPPQTSTSSFESAMGGLSSALKEFGLSSMGGVESEGYSFMVILESRGVKDSIINKYNLSQIYDIPIENAIELREEFDNNLEITYEKEGNYTITIWDRDPERAAQMANDYVEIANKKAVELYHKEQYEYRRYMEMRVQAIDSVINEARDSLEIFSRKYLIYSPTEQAQAMSQAISNLKADQAKYDIFYDFYNSFYGSNDAYTKMYQELKLKTQKKISEVENSPGFAGNFAVNNTAKVGLEYMRLYSIIEGYAMVKTILLPIIEKAKIDESRNVRNLFTVDEAIPPNKKDKPRRSLIVAGSTFGAFVLAILFLVLFDSFREFKKKYNNYIDQNQG